MINKLKKAALLKAADILETGGRHLIGLADAARFAATGEVWDDPLPEADCDCPACQLKRMLGIQASGPVVIPFRPGSVLADILRDAGVPVASPMDTGDLFGFSPLGGPVKKGEA